MVRMSDSEIFFDFNEPVFSDFNAGFFHTLGLWQKKYGRENLRLSAHFFEVVFRNRLLLGGGDVDEIIGKTMAKSGSSGEPNENANDALVRWLEMTSL